MPQTSPSAEAAVIQESPPLNRIQNPLILRFHRLIAALSLSDDERDFYLDTHEGYLVYLDLDKTQEELDLGHVTIHTLPSHYVLFPKLTFYETKKIMEGFVLEKVYDIDTRERLLDIIQSRDSRENFLEFVYEQEVEMEKWQQYYQERFRVRLIEWLRSLELEFVFEEDLDFQKELLSKLKSMQFLVDAPREILQARTNLKAKAKSYYSNEALNPRPKRGRPPKQVSKIESEPLMSPDFYETVPLTLRPFLFIPTITATNIFIFSSKGCEEDLLSPKHRETFQQETGRERPITFGGDFADNDDDEESPMPSTLEKASKEATKATSKVAKKTPEDKKTALPKETKEKATPSLPKTAAPKKAPAATSSEEGATPAKSPVRKNSPRGRPIALAGPSGRKVTTSTSKANGTKSSSAKTGETKGAEKEGAANGEKVKTTSEKKNPLEKKTENSK